MSEQPDSQVRHYLRRIDERLGHIETDMLVVKERLGLLVSQYASLSRRLDTIDGRLSRIGRRLEIVEAEPPGATSSKT